MRSALALCVLLSACDGPLVQPVLPIPTIQFEDGTYCAIYTERLRDCGVIGKGRFQGCHNFDDAAEECELDCVRDATCSDLAAPYCAGDTRVLTELAACEQRCVGYQVFTCTEGTLLHRGAVCDGIDDCNDAADEADCNAQTEFEYACRDGSFYAATEVCDGANDCANGLDEAFCGSLFSCIPSDDQATGFINEVNACDGIRDCEDGSDEPEDCAVAQCPAPAQPEAGAADASATDAAARDAGAQHAAGSGDAAARDSKAP